MGKRIRFDRTEDVRVFYSWCMEESDWPEFVEWMKDAYPIGAEKIAALGFEGVVANMADNEAEPITWEQPYGYGASGSYIQELTDAMREYLRDFAIDAGPVDEDYFDDSGDEELSVEDYPY